MNEELSALFHRQSAAFAEHLRSPSVEFLGTHDLSDSVSVRFTDSEEERQLLAGDVVPFVLRVAHDGYEAETCFGVVLRGSDGDDGLEVGRICNIDNDDREIPACSEINPGLTAQTRILGYAICYL